MFDHIPLMLAQEDAPSVTGSRSTSEIPEMGTSQQLPDTGPMQPTGTSQPGGMGGMLWMFLLMIGVFWFFVLGGQRRDKKKRAALLAAIRKGDKVQTAGGIIGTVVDVRPADVLLKVDENTNTRIKFARTAIQNILQDKDQE